MHQAFGFGASLCLRVRMILSLTETRETCREILPTTPVVPGLNGFLSRPLGRDLNGFLRHVGAMNGLFFQGVKVGIDATHE
jgi:hypothetical protein